jgi:hypothetical protein
MSREGFFQVFLTSRKIEKHVFFLFLRSRTLEKNVFFGFLTSSFLKKNVFFVACMSKCHEKNVRKLALRSSFVRKNNPAGVLTGMYVAHSGRNAHPAPHPGQNFSSYTLYIYGAGRSQYRNAPRPGNSLHFP